MSQNAIADALVRAFSSVSRAAYVTTYEHAARRAGEASFAPSTAWFATHLSDIRERFGLSYARQYAAVVRCHLYLNGVELRCAEQIDDAIAGVDENDPLSHALFEHEQTGMGIAELVLGGYDRHTLEMYHRDVRDYRAAMHARGSDPLFPAADVLAAYLEQKGDEGLSRATSARTAIGQMFIQQRVPAMTMHPQVKALFRALRRRYPRPDRMPLNDLQRDSLFATFSRGLDIDLRNRVLLLFLTLGRYVPRNVCLIKAEMCTLSELGVEIASEDPPRKPPCFIGGTTDAAYDVRVWLPLLLARIAGRGPLFRATKRVADRPGVRDFRFCERAMCVADVNHVVRVAAKAAGIQGRYVAARLRAAFNRTVIEELGLVELAHHRGTRRVSRAAWTEAGRAARLAVGGRPYDARRPH